MSGKQRHQPSWGRTAGAIVAVLVVLVVADALRGIVVAALTAIAVGLVYFLWRYVTGGSTVPEHSGTGLADDAPEGPPIIRTPGAGAADDTRS